MAELMALRPEAPAGSRAIRRTSGSSSATVASSASHEPQGHTAAPGPDAGHQAALKPVGKAWATDTVHGAQARVAVRTGATRRSIRIKNASMKRASVQAWWGARFIEGGTKAHDEKPRRKRVIRFEAQGTIFAKRVHHPATRTIIEACGDRHPREEPDGGRADQALERGRLMPTRVAFQAAARAGAVQLLTDYKADSGIGLQIYPGRPRSINPPSAFVDRIYESIVYLAASASGRRRSR